MTCRKGSSPLARGLRNLPPDTRQCGRIIPARAGFTHIAAPRSMKTRDHPRSRGVYVRVYLEKIHMVGSSPLARGLRLRHGRILNLSGIIPARAGFTPPADGRAPPPSDHPRSRGVYWLRCSSLASPAGSSPLARGLRGGAEAGRARVRDHPRSRGVYEMDPSARQREEGSSPLARGLRAG